MYAAGRRTRAGRGDGINTRAAAGSAADAGVLFLQSDSSQGREPPRFTIDLSQTPEHRYDHVARRLAGRISSADLAGLFSELVGALAPPLLARSLHLFARIVLRRVYSSEETRELRGISAAAGVPVYLLVAFNVLLDLLLGCTSGGVRVEAADARAQGGSRPSSLSSSRMLHFRTLDWGMDPLRKMVVELDFVRRQGGPVVATSVTYFGYVGVLTGVRRGLSMSLNFRARHDRSTRRRRLAFRLHQAMVVLGLRRSISSVLRGYLLRPEAERGVDAGEASVDKEQPAAGRADGPGGQQEEGVMGRILTQLRTLPSSAAYLIFCTPQRVYSVEKDHCAASIRESDTFLTTYNHDVSDEQDPSDLPRAAHQEVEHAIGMSELVAYSTERKRHVDALWRKKLDSRYRRLKRHAEAVGVRDVLGLVKDREVSNEETHYAVIMDPEQGTVLWRRVFEENHGDSG